MPTVVTKTVKASGGDYTSLAAWYAGEQGDLVAADEVRQAEVYSFEDTESVTMYGSNCDSTRYFRVFAAPGHGHSGVWDDTKQRLVVSGDFFPSGITAIDMGTRLEGLQVKVDALDGAVGFQGVMLGYVDTDPFQKLEGCIVQVTGTGRDNSASFGWCVFIGYSAGLGSQFVVNNILYGAHTYTTAGLGIRSLAGYGDGHATGVLYNNTIRDCDVGIYEISTIGANHVKNNIVQDCLSDCYRTDGAWGVDATSNVSDDGTEPSTNGQNGEVEFVDESSNADLHLDPADTVAKGNGADLSADSYFPFNDDIDGQTRSAPWDCGADGLVSAGGGPTFPWPHYAAQMAA